MVPFFGAAYGPRYEIERCILQTGERFGDGSHIVYVNGEYRGDTPLGKLMHDFSCTNPNDMYYDTLAERVRFFKESKEGVEIMCKVMEDLREEYLLKGIEEGIKKGIEQGMQQGIEKEVEQGDKSGQEKNRKEVALRMFSAGKYAADEIAEVSGLSLDMIQGLRAEATA